MIRQHFLEQPVRQCLINTAVLLGTLLVIFIAGEVTIRTLQYYKYLPRYDKGPGKVASNRIMAPKFIRSPNPKLFVEYDPTDPQLNRLGMRGPVPELAKTPGTIRIAVLGDSVAYGYGLPDAQSFPRQLETLLNQRGGKKVEMINFGVCGYGLEAYIEVYRSKVRQFKPDIVILGYILNDMASTEAVFEDVGTLMKKRAKLKKIARKSQFAAWLYHTCDQVFSNLNGIRLFNKGFLEKDNQRILVGWLQSLDDSTREDHVTLVAFIFPYFFNMENYPLTEVHRVINEAMQQVGIPHHDLLEDYRSHDGLALRLEPEDYTHPNAEGQRIAAEAMAAYLQKEKIL